MALTKEQSRALKVARDMIKNEGHMSVTIGGLAGTGKTTVVGHMQEAFGLQDDQIAYAAYTGKAAMVMNKRGNLPVAASTIHSLMYMPREYHCSACPARRKLEREKAKRQAGGQQGFMAMGQDQEKKPPSAMEFCHSVDCPDCGVAYEARSSLPEGLRLVVIDEASMVPDFIYERLMMYGVPVVWVGDHGQLPPVKSSFNLMEDPDVVLEKVHRHVADSPILRLAMQVRRTGLPPAEGVYGNSVRIRRGSGAFDYTEQEWDEGRLVCLVPTNRIRTAANVGIRKARGFSDTPQAGDRVVCLRNNKASGLFNGLTGKVLEIDPGWMGLPYHATSISVDDGDFIWAGSAASDQFGCPRTLAEIDREIDLWDYAYAMTVHKAQGSEYERVVLVGDLSGVGGGASMRKRWLYTAITRAKNKLEIIYPK